MDKSILTRDYDSTELNVNKGEKLEILYTVHQWSWARNEVKQEGWVPCEIFFLDTYKQELKGQNGFLDHVEVNVSNLKISAEFWRFLMEALGYYPYQEWKSGMSWRKGDHYFVIVQAEKKHLIPPYNRKNVGLNHIAFRVNNQKLVDAIRNEAILRGYVILYDEKYPHASSVDEYSLFLEDPDRIKVEIVFRQE